MVRKSRVTTLSLAISAALMMPAVPTLAQDRATTVEEVVVTASRRTETDIQTTPAAVTAISSDDVALLVPRDLGDIAYSVPNFSAAKPAGFNAAAFAMRGVGQTSIIVYQDPQVGVTVDDFVMPSIQTQLLEMIDIERIEVLRGPQGTLFGKNTTGGVVNVRTRKPEFDEATLELQGVAAEHGTFEGQATFNLPLTETLAFRASGMYLESDGYFENGAEYGPVFTLGPDGNPNDIPGITGTSGQGDGDDVGGSDVFAGRFKLLWEPSENFSALLTYEMVRDDSDSPPSVNNTPDLDPNADFNYLFPVLGFSRQGGDQIDNAGLTNRNDVLLNMSDGHQVDVDGYYLNLEWSPWQNDMTLYSITGYREQDSSLPSTYPGEVGPVSLFDATRADNRETFQQEIRLASEFSGPLNFVAGGFYQHDETTFCVSQILGFVDLVGTGEFVSELFTGQAQQIFFNDNPQVLCNEQKLDAYAAYGDVTYELTDRLTLIGGARYTYEEKDWKGRNQVFIQQLPDQAGWDEDFTWRQLNNPLNGAHFGRYSDGVVSDDDSWTEPTWRAVIGYQFTDDVYGYFNYARGFKSGAYNDQTGTTGIPITDAQKAPVDPEKADSFEIGVRTDLFGQKLRLNATAFYVEYDDAQQQLVSTFENELGFEFQETRFFNAAEIEAKGVELETSWLATDNLNFRANVGYLDAEYNKFTADTDFDGIDDVDFSNRDVTRSPEWTAGFDAIFYHRFLGGELQWYGNVSYEDESIFVFSNLPGQPDGKTDDRTLLNASVTYNSPNNTWYLRAFGKNLSDEEYRIGELPVADLWVMTYYGQPRTFGLEAGIRWGF